MKITVKIIAVLATIIGIMTIITGLRVLLGMFDPGYQYFTPLIVYNMIMGVVSVITGILIWKRSIKSLHLASFITCAHIVVLIILKTLFSDIISDESVTAMIFRSVAWIIVTVILWRSFSGGQEEVVHEK